MRSRGEVEVEVWGAEEEVDEVEEGSGFGGEKSREEEKGIELLYVFSIAETSSFPVSPLSSILASLPL
jgi:hypothetical protein